jgi:predicted KAP-like P-loop ATPase
MKPEESMNAQIDGSLLEDAPLEDPSDDLLGRSSFSRSLAQAMLRMNTEHGFVFALYGPWGSGKSTTLNFVLRYINDLTSEEEKPIVVRFNPWWFSGEEQLLLMFFREMRTALSKPDMPKTLRQVGEKIQAFSTLLTPFDYVPGATSVSSPIRKIMSLVGETIRDVGMQAETDVVGVKKEIDKALQSQPRKLLVVIDDIDRLTAEEMRLMFRLIKAVANFPRTIYLLAFDREVVVDAIDDLYPASGDDYLEKIVQAPFNLPLPDRTALQRILLTSLEVLLKTTPSELWDKDTWENVYLDGIDQLVDGPRGIKRLLNALFCAYPAVVGEVNPVDFVAIETLRVLQLGNPSGCRWRGEKS